MKSLVYGAFVLIHFPPVCNFQVEAVLKIATHDHSHFSSLQPAMKRVLFAVVVLGVGVATAC